MLDFDEQLHVEERSHRIRFSAETSRIVLREECDIGLQRRFGAYPIPSEHRRIFGAYCIYGIDLCISIASAHTLPLENGREHYKWVIHRLFAVLLENPEEVYFRGRTPKALRVMGINEVMNWLESIGSR